MNWKEEYKSFFLILAFFLIAYFIPLEDSRFNRAIFEALKLTKWYAREHVILCLIPAFFIAGVISVFISRAAVIKYFGVDAKKWLSYAVASVSGSILAVCSCTILPIFGGIHKRGAGLGPAVTFLYSGPAVNILAIILTARILGLELGISRIIGAVFFAIVIGLIMHLIYRKEELSKTEEQLTVPDSDEVRPLWQTAFHTFVLVAVLIFASWGKPDTDHGFWYFIYSHKWMLTSVFGILLGVSLLYVVKVSKWHLTIGSGIVLISYINFPDDPQVPFIVAVASLSIILYLSPGEGKQWLSESWGFTRQILPLLAAGVLISGFLLGSIEGGEGVIPNEWIVGLVGGNSLFANFFASIVGAFMYFATLTEVPILQGLINGGMGKGPALALLLAGPAISLPNMLVIRSIIGNQKTLVFVALVISMATISGLLYGFLF